MQAIAAAEEFSLSPSAAAAIAAAAEGSVRDALSLLDQLRAFAADEVDDAAVAAVLGVPPLEVTAALVEALAGGRIAAGLASLRQVLAAGQDPTVLYLEIGHALRTLLYLTIDPELGPPLSAAHRAVLQPLAEAHGADTVGRMLGLWVEQEPLVSAAANRDLALEVAAVRLARWPAVQQVEAWLAGAGQVPPPGAGAQPPPSAASSGDVSDPTSGAAPTSSSPSRRTRPAGPPDGAPADSASPEPPSEPADAAAALAESVKADPGVVLATRVFGGDVVAVRRDNQGS
jgi:DNA polymerase-3 subunit gamma/tau